MWGEIVVAVALHFFPVEAFGFVLYLVRLSFISAPYPGS